MSNPTTYTAFVEALHRGIGWARATVAERFYGTLAGVFPDFAAEAHRQAVRARYPATAPPDALPEMGRNQGMRRYPGETIAQFRSRCQQAMTLHQQRGTQQAIKLAFQVLGYTAEVYEGFQWVRPPQPYWSQSWVVLDIGDHPFSPGHDVGHGIKVGAGSLVGISGATLDDITAMQLAIADWKRASGIFREIIVIHSGHIVGGGVSLGTGELVGADATYLPAST